MFEHMSKHKKIVVSGPQRSGTTICAKMIAEDTGHICLLEETFSGQNFWGDFENLYKTLIGKSNIVCQVPSLSPYVHLLPKDVAVVFMIRDISEILASENRISWQDQKRQLERYFREDGKPSELKYDVWYNYQRPRITHCYEVPYNNLKDHPLWVSKENRANFGPRQTEI